MAAPGAPDRGQPGRGGQLHRPTATPWPRSLPPDYTASRVHLDTTTAAAGRQAILQAVNDGVVAFNYIGHGGLDRLAEENLFTSADVAALTTPTGCRSSWP